MPHQGRNVFAALPQWWQQDRKHIETVIEVTTKFATLHHLHQALGLDVRRGRRHELRPRNSVPLSASWKRPILCAIAPVNAPFSWPKSSLSSGSNGIAAQSSFTHGRPRRELVL